MQRMCTPRPKQKKNEEPTIRPRSVSRVHQSGVSGPWSMVHHQCQRQCQRQCRPATVNLAALASSDTRRTCLHRVSVWFQSTPRYAQRPAVPEVPAVARAKAVVPTPKPPTRRPSSLVPAKSAPCTMFIAAGVNFPASQTLPEPDRIMAPLAMICVISVSSPPQPNWQQRLMMP